MLTLNKDDFELLAQFPHVLGHPVRVPWSTIGSSSTSVSVSSSPDLLSETSEYVNVQWDPYNSGI